MLVGVGPRYCASWEVNNFMAVDVVIVCSADNEKLDDAPNPFVDYCLRVIPIYLLSLRPL